MPGPEAPTPSETQLRQLDELEKSRLDLPRLSKDDARRFRRLFGEMPYGGIADFVAVEELDDVAENLGRLARTLEGVVADITKDREELLRYRQMISAAREIAALLAPPPLLTVGTVGTDDARAVVEVALEGLSVACGNRRHPTTPSERSKLAALAVEALTGAGMLR